MTTSKSHMGKLRHKVAGMDQRQIKNVSPRLCHEDGAAQRHSWFQMCLAGREGMPGGSSWGRDSLEGRQGDMQAVTLSALNSCSGTGSNVSSFLAALRMEWRCRHREEPTWNSCQMCPCWDHLPPMARLDLVTSGCDPGVNGSRVYLSRFVLTRVSTLKRK